MFPRITHLEKKSKENKFKIGHYLLFVWKKTDVDIGKEGVLKPTKLCLNILITDLLFYLLPLLKVHLISLILVRIFLACSV